MGGTAVATRDTFSAEELAQLRGFPEIGRGDLIRYFTLAPADEAFVGKFRGRLHCRPEGAQMKAR